MLYGGRICNKYGMYVEAVFVLARASTMVHQCRHLQNVDLEETDECKRMAVRSRLALTLGGG